MSCGTPGFVLDGFPRTLAQARLAYDWAEQKHLTFSAVVHLDVPDDELCRRLATRRAAAERPDDEEAAWQRRLATYRSETEPLLDFYRARGILLEVDAAGSIETVHARVIEALARLGIVAESGPRERKGR